MSKKIIIEVDGGLVQNVFCNFSAEVLVVDRDTIDVVDEELADLTKIKNFCKEDEFQSMDYTSYIFDGELF